MSNLQRRTERKEENEMKRNKQHYPSQYFFRNHLPLKTLFGFIGDAMISYTRLEKMLVLAVIVSIFLPKVSHGEGTWTNYTMADGLVNNYVYSAAVDSQGAVWFGSDTGVSKFDGISWRTYTTVDGLPGNPVQSIAVDKRGAMWFGIGSYGVTKFDGVSWKTYTTADGLVDNNVWSIAVDNQGALWFGTLGLGVTKFDGVSWKTYTTLNGLANDSVWSIAVDHKGALWFGGPDEGGGVSKFDGASWETFSSAPNGLANNQIRSIAVDKKGTLWFGTGGYDGGVSTYDGTSWKTYTTADGLASNYAQAIAGDRQGALWFGTLSKGVTKFDGVSWRTYTTANGLVNNRIAVIVMDKQGALWFGTWGGVSKYEERPTSVSDSRNDTHPETFGFRAAYPNPFNTSTTISFFLSHANKTRLSVYSLSGQFIETLANETMSAGNHRIIWNAAGHSSGMYFLVLESEGVRDIRKIMFVK
jgi:sugar lactone lactonase YvrE